MNWNEFIEINPGLMSMKTPKRVKIKQLGISKLIIVRTKANGGL